MRNYLSFRYTVLLSSLLYQVDRPRIESVVQYTDHKLRWISDRILFLSAAREKNKISDDIEGLHNGEKRLKR